MNIHVDIPKQKKAGVQQALLASIINTSDDAIISINLDTIITSWNQGATTLFGYSGDEVLGQRVSMLIAPDRLKEESAIIQKVARGEYVKHYETEWMGKNGILLPISLNASPIRDPNGNIVGASKILRNISERKQAQKIKVELEEKIRAKAEELTGIFERITDGFIALDRNFCYTYANKKIGEMVGRAPASLIGKYIWDEFPDAAESATGHAIKKAMAEQIFVRNVGFYPPLDLWHENYIYPSPEGLSIFIKDITEQKKSEIKIKQSENIYKTIASSIPGSVICLLDAEYRYLLIEGDMLEKLGYKKEELLGQKVGDVVTPDRYVQVLNDLKRVFLGETFSTESRRMGYDLFTRYVPLKNENNIVFTAMLVSIDVTELKDAQSHIGELNISLEHKVAERTEQLAIANSELEAFTYSVSHDLRAPLRGIIGFTTILEEEYADKLDDEAKRITAVIKSNTLKMGYLIDDLLAFSRMGRHDLAKTGIDTQAMVEEVIGELAPGNNSPVIKWEVQALPWINGDLSIIRQVWVNLISNAIKYSGRKEHPHIEIGSFSYEEQTAFFIKDNGVGFDNKYSDKLFKIFQRLHNADQFEGTGVGLALVMKIISKHGGKLWAEGEVDKGACFYFSLPAE